MQQQLPVNLNYNDVKPVGFPSHVRLEKYTPIAFNSSSTGVSSSDIIRFNISTNGFWDPYSAYIKLEVDVTTSDGQSNNGVTGQCSGTLQVDNSASSFINQLIISKGGTEIERIEEYDTIAAILNDMNSSQDNRSSRYFEGMYAQGVQGAPQYSNPASTYMNSSTYTAVGQCLQYQYNPFVQYNANGLSSNTLLTQLLNATGFNVLNRYEQQLLQVDAKNTVTSTKQTKFMPNNSLANNNIPQTFAGQFYQYPQPFCYSLSSFGNEATLSNYIYQSTTYKGLLGSFIIGCKQSFCIPLISGLLGILMPKESYKYIPMKALQELILEFRLSPYAMFTSGYNDGSYTSSYAIGTTGGVSGAVQASFPQNQLSRIWKINKFEINVEVQYFEPQIENIILSQLNTEKGIVIHSQSWMLGPRYQIAANSSPTGTFQVNLGFESLKNVIWVYIPDEFTTYSFCRKQYRLSANITSMYIKVGSEYFPPLPITGHAGTPSAYQNTDSDANNVEFLVSLYKTFGKFNDIQNNCIVNNVNFAVNDRSYNPTNTTNFSNGSAGYFNPDTVGSTPLFHENRCVGRAIYAMNLETLNQDYSVISGINTINNRPFEITLKSDNTNAFSRSYTTYVFCNYDMLIQLRSSGVQILGRG